MKIFDYLFELGHIWSLIALGGAFFALTSFQNQHEKGKKWARPAQYALGGIILIMIAVLAIKTF